MRQALAADLARLPGVRVQLIDPESNADFLAHAARSTFTIIIAPELGGHLERLCAATRSVGATLWNSSPDALAVAADKRRTATVWQAAGVPTPSTQAFPGCDLPWPRVVKPAFGVGSAAMTLLNSPADFDPAVRRAADCDLTPADLIVQPFCVGVAASVAFLVGPGGVVPLCPALQHLSRDTFTYTGGTVPAPPDVARRASALARHAIDAVPGLAGFVGVDVLIGPHDVAVDLNARLTTSYVGLRAACAGNLAAAWRAVMRGESVEPLRWRLGTVRFQPSGKIDWKPESVQ